MNPKSILSLVLRLVAAFIMLQTLYFKFTAQPESVLIFSKIGIEPWGRIGTGVIELIASVLLLIPRTVTLGAVIAFGTMAGAVLTHIFILGLVVENDGGQLFAYAIIVLVACLIVLLLHRDQFLELKNRFIKG